MPIPLFPLPSGFLKKWTQAAGCPCHLTSHLLCLFAKPLPTSSSQVPPGVDSGSRLRVRGEGNSGRRGGEPGDLYVYLAVKVSFRLFILSVSVPSSLWGHLTRISLSQNLAEGWLATLCSPKLHQT